MLFRLLAGGGRRRRSSMEVRTGCARAYRGISARAIQLPSFALGRFPATTTTPTAPVVSVGIENVSRAGVLLVSVCVCVRVSADAAADGVAGRKCLVRVRAFNNQRRPLFVHHIELGLKCAVITGQGIGRRREPPSAGVTVVTISIANVNLPCRFILVNNNKPSALSLADQRITKS